MKIKRKISVFAAMLTLLTVQSGFSMDDLKESLSKSGSYRETERVELPQINIDEFDQQVMSKVFLEYGTFELVGPSIQKLSLVASQSLEKTRELLSLSGEIFEKEQHQGKYHGFQDLRGETLKMAEQGSKAPIRNQIAFHLRPYYDALDTGGVDIQVYYDYYAQGMLVLQRLYQEIGRCFMDKKRMSNFDKDESSMLTSRRYYQCKENDAGIPTHAHTDYGLLTLAISDQPGLEVLKNVDWIAAPCGTPLPRFYVNVGDWLLFQLNNKAFIPGIHRVPNVMAQRFSVLLFLNPDNNDSIETTNGMGTFQQYAQQRSIYRRDLEVIDLK